MFKLFAAVGRYVMLMRKVFSRPEKAGIYYRRILAEIEALGINSIPLVAIISIFIGAVIALQMGITLESPFIPKFMIGYATRETMTLEFSSTVIAMWNCHTFIRSSLRDLAWQDSLIRSML